MRGFDLKPLFPYSVGFDELDRMLDTAFQGGGRDTSYPPYDILKLGANAYRIRMAVAGFSENDLEITNHNQVLTVRGRAQEPEAEVEYLHRGIARRPFEHRFQLAEHVHVKGARLSNGLLDIDLEREIPEALRPQRIQVTSADSASAPATGKRQVA